MALDANVEIGADINLDTFDKNLETLNKEIEKASKNEIVIEATTKGIKDAEKELSQLNDEIDKQTQLVDGLEAEWRDYDQWREQTGAGTQSWSDTLRSNYESAAQGLDGLIDRHGALEGAVGTAKNEVEEMGKKTEKTGESVKETSKQTSILESAMLSLVANGIRKAISAMDNFVESTYDARLEIATLEQNVNTLGKSLDDVDEIMRGFYLVTNDFNESAAATSNLLASGFDTSHMEKAMEALTGAALKFQGAFNVDSLAEGLQRTIATGTATRQFAEMLKSAGVDVETFNKKIENMSEEGRRNYIVQTLQKAGLNDYYREFVKANPELEDAANVQYDYNEAVLAMGEALQGGKNKIDEIKTAVMGATAEFLESHPNIAQWGYVALVAAGGAGALALGIGAIGKAFKSFFGGDSGNKVKELQEQVKELTKGTGESGQKAAQAAENFLLYAVGIAAVAASIAIVVVAVADLVRAFGSSDESALILAASVAIVVGAVAIAIGVLAALFKLVGDNAVQFVIFAAGLLIISLAISAIVLSFAELVKAMNESDESAQDIANAITQITLTIGIALGVIAILGTVLGSAAPQLLMFGVALLVVAAAALILAAAIALIRGDFRDMNLSVPSLPTMGKLRGNAGGYATGTQSARRGWNWVDETTNDPRLLWFNGGEAVLNTSQTAAKQGMLGQSGGRVNNYYFGGVSVPVDRIKSLVDIAYIMENETGSMSQGYVGD